MLTRRFAWLGLPIVILTAVLLIGTYRYVVLFNLQSSVEGVAASMAQIFANTLWKDYQPLVDRSASMSADEIRADPLTRGVDREVSTITAGTRVLKIKVYSLAGITLYSSDPRQIGSDYSKSPQFPIALNGGTASNLSRRSHFDGIHGPRSNVVVLESYVPAYSPSGGGNVIAVMEIYSDVTDLEGNILGRAEVLVAMLAIVLSLAISYGVQLWVLRRAERRLHHEHVERLKITADLAVAHEANRAKSAFLANMSHELRTPLNAIIGFSEILQTETFGPIGQKRYIEYATDINMAGYHLLHVIDEVLDLSKIEAGKVDLNLSVIDPTDVIAAALDMLGPDSERHGVEIRRALAAPIPVMETDEGKLRQIILNLVSNSLKYTRPGGSVTVSMEVDTDLSATQITICDTGVGMSEDELAVAMTPFGRINNAISDARGGTGLGLPLTKNFVNLLGGSFRIESTPGVGTTVSIQLPIIAAS
jgi:two-component system cell cycle sensor histidine kinase PleC